MDAIAGFILIAVVAVFSVVTFYRFLCWALTRWED